jgi:DNA-binding transcriptional LysR family regulator
MAPPVSTHHTLANELFAARGSAPATLIEADNEAVTRSLVASGLGVALVREDVAREGEAAGEIVVWPGARLATTLQFVHARAKREEPELRAIVGVIRDVWREAGAQAGATTIVRRTRTRRAV